jgi:FkbM family methyltransferase
MMTKVVNFNYQNRIISLELRPDTQDEDMARKEVFSNYYLKYGNLEIKEGDTVLDLGANIGSFSIAAAILGAKKIVAVEPCPDSITLLEHNLETNKELFSEPVTIFRGGIMGNGESKAPLYLSNDPHGSGGHTLNLPESENPESHKSVEVAVTSLDELIKNTIGDGIVDFLKLDIEGAEYEVLMTCQSLPRIRQISLEWHRGPVNFAGLLKFLATHGYSVAWFEGDNDRGKLQVRLNNI